MIRQKYKQEPMVNDKLESQGIKSATTHTETVECND